MVVFVGAGPGDPDLLTIRGRRIIEQADLVVWADSLVHPGVAALARPDAEVIGSATMTLEDDHRADDRGGPGRQAGGAGPERRPGRSTAPCTSRWCCWTPPRCRTRWCPGVSAVFAAAAALDAELTVPEVAQTVILTRLPSRTTIPEQEQLRAMAAHGGTIALFLTINVIERAVAELIAGGYAADTPAAVLHRVTWEDETIIRGTLADIAAAVPDGRPDPAGADPGRAGHRPRAAPCRRRQPLQPVRPEVEPRLPPRRRAWQGAEPRVSSRSRDDGERPA